MISQNELKTLVTYLPDEGYFVYNEKIDSRNRRSQRAYKCAGDFLIGGGYLGLGIEKRVYSIHRLVWLYEYGYFPKEIDHINGIRTDNRLENLREVSRSQNNWNSKTNSVNTSGHKGISLEEKYLRYKAYVKQFGKRYAKNFSFRTDTKEIALQRAVEWVRETREMLHGEYAHHG